MAFALGILVLASATAGAATHQVTNLADAGQGSLRSAVSAAAAGDTIVFRSGLKGVIRLRTSLLVPRSVSIRLAQPAERKLFEPAAISLDAGEAGRLLEIPASAKVVITDLGFQNGLALEGGAVRNSGELELVNCVFQHNTAQPPGNTAAQPRAAGGAVFNAGILRLNNCLFVDNQAEATAGGTPGAQGGAIYHAPGAQLRARGCIFGFNAALGQSSGGRGQAQGGAIYLAGGSASLQGTVFLQNRAHYRALASSAPSGHGHSVAGGGAFYQQAGTVEVRQSTFSGNYACAESSGQTSLAQGGALAIAGGTLEIASATICGNAAEGRGPSQPAQTAAEYLAEGGGLWLATGGTATLVSTVLAGNLALGPAPMGNDGHGPVTSRGFNFIGIRERSFASGEGAVGGTDHAGVPGTPLEPLLGSLQVHRNTLAMLPLPGSPLVDQGWHGPGDARDQAGAHRAYDYLAIGNAPHGTGADIGAAESLPAVEPDFNADGHADLPLLHTSGRTKILLMHGAVNTGELTGPTVPRHLRLSAVLDFTGDGHPDYLLLDPRSRRTVVWHLKEGTLVSQTPGPTIQAGWTLGPAADFNRDGCVDLLLAHPRHRSTAIWHLDERFKVVRNVAGPQLPTGCSVRAVTDLNGDEQLDLLLQHTPSGRLHLWHLRGSSVIFTAEAPRVPSPWTLSGVQDLTGDLQPDLLLCDLTARKTSVRPVQGEHAPSVSSTGPQIAAGYRIVPPGGLDAGEENRVRVQAALP